MLGSKGPPPPLVFANALLPLSLVSTISSAPNAPGSARTHPRTARRCRGCPKAWLRQFPHFQTKRWCCPCHHAALVKRVPLQTPAPSSPSRIHRAGTSHPCGNTFLEPKGLAGALAPLPRVADLFPPTAVFRAAVWGEIPQLPQPVLRFALVPIRSHPRLSSPPIPTGPHPLPVQGGIRAGLWHRETQQSPIPAQVAPGMSSMASIPPPHHTRSVELCQNMSEGDAGAKVQARPPPANCSPQRGRKQSPALHPHHTSAAPQRPGLEVLMLAIVNRPAGLSRRPRQRDPCPVIAQPSMAVLVQPGRC